MIEKMMRAMIAASQEVHPAQQPYTDVRDGWDDVVLGGCFDFEKMVRAGLEAIQNPSAEILLAVDGEGGREDCDLARFTFPEVVDAILSEPHP